MEKDDRGPYVETLALEALFSAFRFLPALMVAGVIGGIVGFPLLILFDSNDGEPLLVATLWLGVLLALSPVIASVLTLTVLPGGYALTRRELGAREPSTREREALLSALQELTETAPSGTIEPSRWLVIDAIDPNALVVGTTIYVHRELFRTPYLLPVLAHELGHLNHGDGRLVLALRRLVPPPLSYLSFEGGGCLPLLLKLCGGGLGLSITTPAWNNYWQKRELLADRFAFECGQADGLIEFLETYQFFDVAVPFHSFASTHPYSETRIDRLQDLLEEEANAPAEPSPAAEPRPGKSPLQHKQKFTDADSFLDLVVLDLYHPGSDDPWRIVNEQAWIKANGRRIVDLAQAGAAGQGAGIIWILWFMDRAPESQYDDENFMYRKPSFYSTLVNNQEFRDEFNFDREECRRWEKIIEMNDPEQSVAILIVSQNRKIKKGYANHYLVGMRDGGPLPVGGKR